MVRVRRKNVKHRKEVPLLTAEHIEGFVEGCLKSNFDTPSDIPECHREWWQMCCSKHKFVAIAAPRGQ